MPTPPADRAVCELEKVKRRQHPDQELTDSVPLSVCAASEEVAEERRRRWGEQSRAVMTSFSVPGSLLSRIK